MLAIILNSCAAEDKQGGPSEAPIGEGDFPTPVTLDEAQLLLPFEVRLPSFLPNGTSRMPKLYVFYEADGSPYLNAIYRQERSVSAGTPRLRIRIQELRGHFSPGATPGSEVVDIHGTRVEFAIYPLGREYAEAAGYWSANDTVYFADFYWPPDSEADQTVVVTDQERADALRVIESMLE